MNEIFQIFNPDWWLDENNNALQMVDAVLFLISCIPVAYLLIYSLFSLGKYKNPYPKAEIKHRFLIVYTVLRNGKEVIDSINHCFATQQYPRDKYDIAVAGTQLPEEDLITLLQMPVNIVVPDKDSCTKVYAVQQVMERYSPDEYDMVLFLNSDNRLVPNALNLFNNAYYSGCDSIQAHRMTANLDSHISVLSATSEEINNNIFRKGHTRLGFSSALIGSAMAFDFKMFHEIAPTLSGSDLATTTEVALLKQNIYTEYLEELICLSKKQESASGYEQQRANWANSQYNNTFYAALHLPGAILRGQWDYANKLFQWCLPSRFLLIAFIILCGCCIAIGDWTLSPKWGVLLLTLGFTFIIALPDGEINRRFKKSVWMLPLMILTVIFSLIKRLFHKAGKTVADNTINKKEAEAIKAKMKAEAPGKPLSESERLYEALKADANHSYTPKSGSASFNPFQMGDPMDGTSQVYSSATSMDAPNTYASQPLTADATRAEEELPTTPLTPEEADRMQEEQLMKMFQDDPELMRQMQEEMEKMKKQQA